MAELIDISNDKFWDILFDEACVEGQQAERIEKELKTISTTEAEIRAMAIDEFAEKIRDWQKEVYKNDRYAGELDFLFKHIYEISEQLKEEY